MNLGHEIDGGVKSCKEHATSMWIVSWWSCEYLCWYERMVSQSLQGRASATYLSHHNCERKHISFLTALSTCHHLQCSPLPQSVGPLAGDPPGNLKETEVGEESPTRRGDKEVSLTSVPIQW